METKASISDTRTTRPTASQHVLASISRRYPLFSGGASIANSSWFIRWSGSGRGRRAWAQVPGGEVIAALDDYVGRASFYTGDLDPKLTWVCKQLIGAGDTVVDIGANIGLMSVLFAKLVGAKGIVHVFEPNPLLQEVLAETVERNRATSVRLHRMALGEEPGVLELCTPSDNAGQGSLVFHKNRADSQRYTVPVRTLSDVLGEAKTQKIRLIKIDVEGFEFEVLKGARELLMRVKPDAILFELNDGSLQAGIVSPVVQFLQDMGFQFFSIPRCIMRMRVQRHRPGVVQGTEGHDLIAVQAGDVYRETGNLLRAED